MLDVYAEIFGESGRDERANSIVEHLQRVAAATTIEEAEEVIAWWDCWAPRGPRSLRRTTRRLVRLLTQPW